MWNLTLRESYFTDLSYGINLYKKLVYRIELKNLIDETECDCAGVSDRTERVWLAGGGDVHVFAYIREEWMISGLMSGEN